MRTTTLFLTKVGPIYASFPVASQTRLGPMDWRYMIYVLHFILIQSFDASFSNHIIIVT